MLRNKRMRTELQRPNWNTKLRVVPTALRRQTPNINVLHMSKLLINTLMVFPFVAELISFVVPTSTNECNTQRKCPTPWNNSQKLLSRKVQTDGSLTTYNFPGCTVPSVLKAPSNTTEHNVPNRQSQSTTQIETVLTKWQKMSRWRPVANLLQHQKLCPPPWYITQHGITNHQPLGQ